MTASALTTAPVILSVTLHGLVFWERLVGCHMVIAIRAFELAEKVIHLRLMMVGGIHLQEVMMTHLLQVMMRAPQIASAPKRCGSASQRHLVSYSEVQGSRSRKLGVDYGRLASY